MIKFWITMNIITICLCVYMIIKGIINKDINDIITGCLIVIFPIVGIIGLTKSTNEYTKRK